METVDITIERREHFRKGGSRRLRAGGRVPAILYGPKRTTVPISVSAVEFGRKLAHLEGTHLVRLISDTGDGDLHDRVVLMREMQEHPVTGAILHVDFYEVDLTARITVSVPLHFVGRAAGVVAGGILQPVMREVAVECLPTEIPEFLEIDVSPLGIHDALHVRDIRLPQGVTAETDGAQTVVTVVSPTVEEVVTPAAAAEPVAAEAPAAEAGTKTEGEG